MKYFQNIIYPKGDTLTNDDLTPEMLKKQKLAAHKSNMISLIDLSTTDYKVILFNQHNLLSMHISSSN